MIAKLELYHQVGRVQQQIKQNPDQVAFREWHKEYDEALTWHQAGQKIKQIAQALLTIKTKVQAKIAIFAHNSINWALVDLAILHLRGITVPIYATNTTKQAAFIINDVQAEVLFVGGQAQLDSAIELRKTCSQLRYIIALDHQIDLRGCDIAFHLSDFCQLQGETTTAEFSQRIAQRSLSDLFTIIYTSGTTGDPKGVMLDYRNMAAQLDNHDHCLSVTPQDISLSFLPLSHVFERAWSFYVMHVGAQNVYLCDTALVREALQAVQPTVMCAVPRFYEKIFSAIYEQVKKQPFYRRVLFHIAIWSGKRKVLAAQQQHSVDKFTQLIASVMDKFVLTKLRRLVGGNIRFMPAAGAKLDDKILLFFLAIGIQIKYGYGMTETCATVSCWHNQQCSLGSIGRPVKHQEVRISDNNEIQVRGMTVMRGYYNRPIETAESFTTDGWLKTGDVGELQANGNLFITERLKDLMKTSNGKYIAPQTIEGTLGQDRFIDQVAIIADTRKFVSALIVPCFESLEEYAKSINLAYKDRLELLKNSAVIELFEKRLSLTQKEFARFEQVKRFTLLPQAFSMEQGELTPTLKLRRKIIQKRYRLEIESMYMD